MTFEFRPAKREGVGLLIGLVGGTGGGKTYSGMQLATGLSGDKPFAVIDTEASRAKHYADRFRFDHGDLKPPFTPDRYADAIAAADAAGYTAIVVDSASHEWAGDGGILDIQEAELTRMAGAEDWKKREACKLASWIRPKMAHKHFVTRLLQVRAHILLCFRAEPKVDMVRDANGRMQVVPKQGLTARDGWFPVCEKSFPYEMTASFLLMAEHPGVPLPIKLEEQHRPYFPAGKPITAEAGTQLAAWARGDVPAAREGPSPRRSVAIDEYTDAIATATSEAQLAEIAERIRRLPREQQELLREPYRTHLAALRAEADARIGE